MATVQRDHAQFVPVIWRHYKSGFSRGVEALLIYFDPLLGKPSDSPSRERKLPPHVIVSKVPEERYPLQVLDLEDSHWGGGEGEGGRDVGKWRGKWLATFTTLEKFLTFFVLFPRLPVQLPVRVVTWTFSRRNRQWRHFFLVVLWRRSWIINNNNNNILILLICRQIFLECWRYWKHCIEWDCTYSKESTWLIDRRTDIERTNVFVCVHSI